MIDWLFYTSYGVGFVAMLLGTYQEAARDGAAYDYVAAWAFAVAWPVIVIATTVWRIVSWVHRDLQRIAAKLPD